MATYPEIRRQIETLSPDEQLLLLEELAAIVRRRVKGSKRSILELEGLGKELWQGMDVREYIDRERNSWNG